MEVESVCKNYHHSWLSFGSYGRNDEGNDFTTIFISANSFLQRSNCLLQFHFHFHFICSEFCLFCAYLALVSVNYELKERKKEWKKCRLNTHTLLPSFFHFTFHSYIDSRIKLFRIICQLVSMFVISFIKK